MSNDIKFIDLKEQLRKRINNVNNTNDSYDIDGKDTTKLMQESHYHHTINDVVLLMVKYGYRNVLDNIEVAYYNMYYNKDGNVKHNK